MYICVYVCIHIFIHDVCTYACVCLCIPAFYLCLHSVIQLSVVVGSFVYVCVYVYVSCVISSVTCFVRCFIMWLFPLCFWLFVLSSVRVTTVGVGMCSVVKSGRLAVLQSCLLDFYSATQFEVTVAIGLGKMRVSYACTCMSVYVSSYVLIGLSICSLVVPRVH